MQFKSGRYEFWNYSIQSRLLTEMSRDYTGAHKQQLKIYLKTILQVYGCMAKPNTTNKAARSVFGIHKQLTELGHKSGV